MSAKARKLFSSIALSPIPPLRYSMEQRPINAQSNAPCNGPTTTNNGVTATRIATISFDRIDWIKSSLIL